MICTGLQNLSVVLTTFMYESCISTFAHGATRGTNEGGVPSNMNRGRYATLTGAPHEVSAAYRVWRPPAWCKSFDWLQYGSVDPMATRALWQLILFLYMVQSIRAEKNTCASRK